VKTVQVTPVIIRRLERLKQIMIKEDLRPPGCDKYVPAFHHILVYAIHLLEEDLGVEYEKTKEFRQEELRRLQDGRDELEEYNYRGPEETRKWLEERKQSHLLMDIPFKFESEETQ